MKSTYNLSDLLKSSATDHWNSSKNGRSMKNRRTEKLSRRKSKTRRRPRL